MVELDQGRLDSGRCFRACGDAVMAEARILHDVAVEQGDFETRPSSRPPNDPTLGLGAEQLKLGYASCFP
jgi:hypothetical protein